MKAQLFARLPTLALITFLGSILCSTVHAQTTATWIGPATGGEWNTAANWDTGLPPADPTTNAFIGPGITVNYNAPMIAASFGALTNRGVLNVNTGGFNSGSISLTFPAGTNRMFINNGGVVNVTGDVGICSNNVVSMSAGSALTISGALYIGSNPTGGSGGATIGAFGSVTNNGGALSAASTFLNPNNASIGTSCRLMINGGTNNLGALTINRSPGGNSAPPALGSDGLVITSGFVNVSSIILGNNAHGIIYLTGGTMTNLGAFTIRNATSTRPARFHQTGGLFVTTDPSLVTLNPSGVNGDMVYSVIGGTNIVGGLVFGNAATVGTALYTNAASMYIGSGGMSSNGVVAVNASLNSGGLLGASADWSGSVAMALSSGTFTFQAADLDGTPHNISISGALRGSGNLRKMGVGRLTLGGLNTYSGNTLINAGTLAIDVAGALPNSLQILTASNTVFDVSAVSGGFTNNRTLGGFGSVTGPVVMASAAVINPGSNAVSGTLTMSDLDESAGGAINHFDLSGSPTGPGNDSLNVTGTFTAGTGNTIEIAGSIPSGAVYPLITYGTFNGNVSTFTVTGVVGALSNNAVTKTIYLTTQSSLRSTTNLTWVGQFGAAGGNIWDTLTNSNWLPQGSGTPTFSIPGDTLRFTSAATAVETNIVILGSQLPASVTVDATNHYTFLGSGQISGSASLVKTNAGTLTVLTTNNYTGITFIGGGILEVSNVVDGGLPGPLGAATADPANRQYSSGGILRYLGDSASSDRGATLNAGGGNIEVSVSSTFLTNNGSIQGIGSLTKSGPGTLVIPVSDTYSGGTVISNGAIFLDSNNANSSGLGTNSVTFYNGAVLRLFGADNNDSSANHYSALTVPLIVPVGQSGTLRMFPRGPTDNTGITSSLSGSGILNLVASFQRGSIDGDWSAFTGLINVSNRTSADHFRIKSGIGLTNASVYLNDNVIFYCNGTANSILEVGELGGDAGTFLGLGTTTQNNAAANPTWVIGRKNTTATFAGTIRNDGTTTIIKVGSGTWNLSGANTYSGSTTVSNGVLALRDNGSIDNSTNISVGALGTLDVSLRVDGTLNLGNAAAQNLTGSGTIRGSVLLNGNSTINPGDGIGTLTITNLATLNGTVIMELNRSTAARSDKLVAQSFSVSGATLNVVNLGPDLANGDTFTLFNTGVPGFTVNLPTTDSTTTATYVWDDQIAANGTIRLVSGGLNPVNSNPTNITFSASGGVMTLTWPADHIGWHLQAQTNSLSVGLKTNWVEVVGSTTTNRVDLPIGNTNGAVFFRLIYP